MRASYRLGGVILGAAAVLAAESPAAAQRDTLQARVDSLQRRLDEVEQRLRRQEDQSGRAADAAMAADERAKAARDTGGFDPRQRVVSGIGNRPFARRFGRGAAVGGYMDLELRPEEPGDDEYSFIQHRLIPFIFAEVSDRIHFGTELEFEEGGEEISVEFAALDVKLAEWLSFRGGLLLSPLGKFNLIHDSPVNDLTERPLVDQQIIPTTLSEAGIGFNGQLYPSARSVLTYEAYVVNGFNEGLLQFDETTGALSGLRIRQGRGNAEEDNNGGKSVVARVGFSPFLGLELGASGHTGTFANEEDRTPGLNEDARLTIFAIDGIFNRGPFELLGEFAHARADLPAGAPFGGAQQGWYLQGNFHFGHDVVPIFPHSVFTAVGRWDQVDFDTSVSGDAQRRLTLGLNFRPIEETVFKLDWLNDWTAARGSGFGGRTGTFEFSLATYF